MSITPVVQPAPGSRRVRHQARDAVVLMSFSAGTSLVLAALLTFLSNAGR